jgi:CheY-like chemotaxis protein
MSKPRILVVEDAPEVADIIRIAFRRTELVIDHVFNAMRALMYLEDHRPHAILLDLGMPGMHGWEFLERIREQDVLRHIPVIVLTAHNDYANRKTGKLFNVNAYLQKPIDLVKLRTAVDNAVYLRQ